MATASTTKKRALLDAERANAAALAHTLAASQPPPPYHLLELIGKGSFGRVYKARTTTSSPSLVAVKVIDIERGDAAAPGLADTLADLQTELRALRALDDATNVNHVLEALLVGPAVWLVVEYCAGGSVATLMRPVRDAAGTGTGGLRERWIVPVLRETAAALAWVHARGVIHRDVKAANVLVAEDGRGVQLCDFGVAAMLRGTAEKRKTLVGTPHAMAPELLAGSSSAAAAGDGYGTEVDVWAFGALAYELATGRPPNAALGMGLAKLGRQLQMEMPRLVGDAHSAGLKDLVACCLQRDPAARPTMEAVRRHAYLADTETRFPTASLAQLVRAFRLWEAQGGDRRSLFAEGGAAGMSDGGAEHEDSDDDDVLDWNFSTAVEADVDHVLDASDSEALAGAYGIDSRREEPQQTYRRRRRAPPKHAAAAAVKSPLEKVFDSNTLSNYDEYSRQYYAKFLPAPVQQALWQNGVAPADGADRDSLIDLDLCLVVDSGNSSSSSSDSSSSSAFSSVDLGTETIRPGPLGWGEAGEPQGDGSMRRATQDWKFPSFFPQPALESSRSPPPRWDEAAAAAVASDASHSRGESLDSLIDLDWSVAPPPPSMNVECRRAADTQHRPREPPAPLAPLPQVMLGQAGDEQVKDELRRLTASLSEHLRYATVQLGSLPVGRASEN